jgi:hypothetical protein
VAGVVGAVGVTVAGVVGATAVGAVGVVVGATVGETVGVGVVGVAGTMASTTVSTTISTTIITIIKLSAYDHLDMALLSIIKMVCLRLANQTEVFCRDSGSPFHTTYVSASLQMVDYEASVYPKASV